jgi:hypothetical protein
MHGMQWCTVLCYHARYAVVHSSPSPCTVCSGAKLSVTMQGMQWCTVLCYHARYAVVHSSPSPCTVCSGAQFSVTMHGMHWCTALCYHARYAVVHSSLLPCTVCSGAQLCSIIFASHTPAVTAEVSSLKSLTWCAESGTFPAISKSNYCICIQPKGSFWPFSIIAFIAAACA